MTEPVSQVQARPGSWLAFFRGFLKSPKGVGSVIPSSRFMERAIIQYARPESEQVVVELGPGTGGTTRALLGAMRDDARLLAIDLDPAFTAIVSAIPDPRLIAHTGSAADLVDILGQYQLDSAGVVVSGIPFSTMPRPVAEAVIDAVHAALRPGGAFVAYQFRSEVARVAEPVFGPAVRTEKVVLNVPPMRIWRWEKQA
ncbi:MAG: rRNA adenine N-6-methyltransferase family protein [Wenzhouxiangellaceae bacterium]